MNTSLTARFILCGLLYVFASLMIAVSSEGPFVITNDIREGIPKELLTILEKSEEDYQAVLTGKEPVHAKYIENSYTLDGGTRAYQGEGYKIIVLHQIARIGDASGNLYGPIIEYENKSFFSGKIANVRFYTSAELQKLKLKAHDIGPHNSGGTQTIPPK